MNSKLNKKNPLVSIITVTFNLIKNNRVETFKQCVESVKSQSYKNIEHLVVDGDSTDGTKLLLEKYKKQGFIKFISEPDKGIYEAMNKGITLSKGKYVTFLNSDDYYHDNNGVDASIAKLEESGAIFSYAPVLMVPEKGTLLYENHPHLNPKIKNVYCTMPFCHQTMFVRRDKIISEGKFDKSFKSSGDYDLVLRLCLKNHKSVFVQKKFVTFRFGGLSDKNQRQSVEEVSNAYYKNFKKICIISKRECEQIYCNGYEAIPLNLGLALKTNQYFDYNLYLKKLEGSRKKLCNLRALYRNCKEELKKINDSKFWKVMMFFKKIYKFFELKNAKNK